MWPVKVGHLMQKKAERKKNAKISFIYEPRKIWTSAKKVFCVHACGHISLELTQKFWAKLHELEDCQNSEYHTNTENLCQFYKIGKDF